MGFFKKPFRYAAVFSLALVVMTAYLLLEVFVIPHAGTVVDGGDTSLPSETVDADGGSAGGGDATDSEDGAAESTETPEETEEPAVTENSYSDGNVQITITTLRKDDTNVYVAEVVLSSAGYLKTALAQNTFGVNITETTSDTAESAGAVLAVNGDFYGANRRGYVIKNGTLYRDTVRSDSEYPDLAIYADGSFNLVYEDETTAQALIDSGVVQLFAFGPSLIENGEISVSKNEEIDQAMSSNPRTAIGIVSPLHYVFVVSDGRTSESAGLSLYELAEIMADYGCETAYNLDGGGSSTMYFNGSVINKPTTNGKTITERAVSDIVCIVP